MDKNKLILKKKSVSLLSLNVQQQIKGASLTTCQSYPPCVTFNTTVNPTTNTSKHINHDDAKDTAMSIGGTLVAVVITEGGPGVWLTAAATTVIATIFNHNTDWTNGGGNNGGGGTGGKYKASDIPGIDGCGYGGGGGNTTDTEPKTSECVSRNCSFVN